ncbi:hypothetical protein PHLGIDRAFT_123582 [Phlebiopsis gigantea 11061_1 CR5-6]|uniref:Uncharacterized protein n=1 Tax=Phlebiopsis gigantea (strain 11061_1 CR5-6) TaxID=745531 RepID=A0A0C3S178_PHLG1|nr:hypothetical protein PHLGIDRAFT_123582 [Phlebiopsis gigantea 11061_1 CR5-6]
MTEDMPKKATHRTSGDGEVALLLDRVQELLSGADSARVTLARRLAQRRLRDKLKWQLARIGEDEDRGHYLPHSVWRNANDDRRSYLREYDLGIAGVGLMTTEQLVQAAHTYVKDLREGKRSNPTQDNLPQYLASLLKESDLPPPIGAGVGRASPIATAPSQSLYQGLRASETHHEVQHASEPSPRQEQASLGQPSFWGDSGPSMASDGSASGALHSLAQAGAWTTQDDSIRSGNSLWPDAPLTFTGMDVGMTDAPPATELETLALDLEEFLSLSVVVFDRSSQKRTASVLSTPPDSCSYLRVTSAPSNEIADALASCTTTVQGLLPKKERVRFDIRDAQEKMKRTSKWDRLRTLALVADAIRPRRAPDRRRRVRPRVRTTPEAVEQEILGKRPQQEDKDSPSQDWERSPQPEPVPAPAMRPSDLRTLLLGDPNDARIPLQWRDMYARAHEHFGVHLPDVELTTVPLEDTPESRHLYEELQTLPSVVDHFTFRGTHVLPCGIDQLVPQSENGTLILTSPCVDLLSVSRYPFSPQVHVFGEGHHLRTIPLAPFERKDIGSVPGTPDEYSAPTFDPPPLSVFYHCPRIAYLLQYQDQAVVRWEGEAYYDLVNGCVRARLLESRNQWTPSMDARPRVWIATLASGQLSDPDQYRAVLLYCRKQANKESTGEISHIGRSATAESWSGALNAFARRGYHALVAEVLTDDTTGQMIVLPKPTAIETLHLSDIHIPPLSTTLSPAQVPFADKHRLIAQVTYTSKMAPKKEKGKEVEGTKKKKNRIGTSTHQDEDWTLELFDRSLVEVTSQGIRDTYALTAQEHRIFGRCETMVPKGQLLEVVRYEMMRNDLGRVLRFTGRRITPTNSDVDEEAFTDISDAAEPGPAVRTLSPGDGAANNAASSQSTPSSFLSYASILDPAASSPQSFHQSVDSIPGLESLCTHFDYTPFISGDSRPVTPATWRTFIARQETHSPKTDPDVVDQEALASLLAPWNEGIRHNALAEEEQLTADPRRVEVGSTETDIDSTSHEDTTEPEEGEWTSDSDYEEDERDEDAMDEDEYSEPEDEVDELMEEKELYEHDPAYYGTPVSSAVLSRAYTPDITHRTHDELPAQPQVQVFHAIAHDAPDHAQHTEHAENLVTQIVTQALLQLQPAANLPVQGIGPLSVPSPDTFAVGHPLADNQRALLAIAGYINIRAALLDVYHRVNHTVYANFQQDYFEFLAARQRGPTAALADIESTIPYSEEYGTPFLFACEQWTLRRYRHFFIERRDRAPEHIKPYFAAILHDTGLALQQGEGQPDAASIRKLRRNGMLGQPWAVRPIVCGAHAQA